ncbi:hypothetical protein IJG89_02150 [Candidatus Saccharibacteria bacterium]|nr:hypothetical protein [Candidatus Saccharibacteria bacterium]
MNIYISGISGTGMGPLALMAKKAGFNVSGSDPMRGAIYEELVQAGIDVKIGVQDGEFLKQKIDEGVDWFVYTSALPEDHPELILARNAGIKCTKRDEFTAFLVDELKLKMVAVAGTHGKTTTTAMIVWAALKTKLPASYIVGTTLGFAPSGSYHKGDKYFIYEADEYDRNFLKYHPWLAVIPSISYDHPDIYPTKEDYKKAFEQFKKQSRKVIENTRDGLKNNMGDGIMVGPEDFKLAGKVRRIDAALATEAVIQMIFQDAEDDGMMISFTPFPIVDIMNKFPGVGRRFERIGDGVYTDYAHHPEEIVATMNVAREEAELRDKKGVVVVYQPHQNTRQHKVKDGYVNAFDGAHKVFWLPTYLTREDKSLPVIKPEEFIEELANKDIAEVAELDDELEAKLKKYVGEGYLVILMTAGPADEWFRKTFML